MGVRVRVRVGVSVSVRVRARIRARARVRVGVRVARIPCTSRQVRDALASSMSATTPETTGAAKEVPTP